MRTLSLLACAALAAAALTAVAGASGPTAGSLSLERGRGVVTLDLRGVVLGRLTAGSLRVVDTTPRDRHTPLVMGRRVTEERIGPRTVLYRGQGLRFRMLGGGYRITIRANGISLSVVGRGTATLDGEPRFAGDSTGVYSFEDGVDCGFEPELCTALPEEAQRFLLEPEPVPGGSMRLPPR
jgi:hypothetical protein